MIQDQHMPYIYIYLSSIILYAGRNEDVKYMLILCSY